MYFYNKIFISILLLINSCNIIAMDQISCKLATTEDAPDILDLFAHYASHDAAESVVIVPKIHRVGYIQSAINDRRLAIARAATVLVGIKKIYVVPDDHVQEVLGNELNVRPDNLLVAGAFGIDNQFRASAALSDVNLCPDDVYVYTGTDYTRPDFRGKGVNSQLYTYAFACLKESILNHFKNRQSRNIHLLYGLVKKNGPHNGVDGRTESILKSFRQFVQSLPIKQNKPIQFQSYQAQMPIFNPEAQELDLSAITHFIDGSGCILSYPVSQ